MYVLLLTLNILLINHIVYSANSDDCDARHGPSGLTECVLLQPQYSKYQWATCLTDAYIQSKSRSRNKNHQCTDRTATYCWYQCMIEVHDDGGSGPVFDDCACDPNGRTHRPLSSTLPPIEDWCYSPAGGECNWYRECLEKRHSCESTDHPYAITYAEHYCDLYTKRRSKFSDYGQQWIDGVRKCLQMKLVPYLRRWNDDASCEEIRQAAFNSHAECYTNPGYNAPSVCDISFVDWWSVFWTIKGSFLSTPYQSIKGALDVRSACNRRDDVFNSQSDIALLTIDIEWQPRLTLNTEIEQSVAGKIADEIAKSLNWKGEGVSWFAFSRNATTNTQNQPLASPSATSNAQHQPLTFSLLLGSEKTFDFYATNSSIADLNATVSALQHAVQEEGLSISIDQNPLRIINIAECQTATCEPTKRNMKTSSLKSTSP